MLGALAAACCDTQDVGLDFNGGIQIGDSVADVEITRKPKPSASGPGGGFIRQIEDAIQAAVHPDSVSGGGAGGRSVNLDGGGSYQSGAQVIPFPVVSPYRPLTATRAPVAGLTAFPKAGHYFNGETGADFNGETGDPNDHVPPGFENLGFIDPVMEAPQGIGLESDSFGSLGMQWEGLIGQGIQTIPGIISAGKGKPYYDPSANLNPQLYGRPGGGVSEQPGGGVPPAGYYYDERGTLQQVGGAVGGAVGGIGQSISDFVSRNPLIVLGVVVGGVLLFMSPPRRR